ncbi:MAG: class I SAM-dependent methyltransferase [Verrucomicrobia bacterium]|nr:class I SAM-dependent methyltransferase [Verrucomicrobiota bacterium]
MNRQGHWNQAYRTNGAQEVSWYQRRPDLSLTLIAASGVAKDAGIIDAGGGASTLVDFLLDEGYTRLAVLDVSPIALAHARSRLGARAETVQWFEADVTSFVPPHRFGLWHDRAVFHFLTDKADREKYADALRRTLAPGGQAIIATFAMDGPCKCSGLRTVRYDAPSILAELGPGLRLVGQVDETHLTPGGSEQEFSYFRFSRTAAGAV